MNVCEVRIQMFNTKQKIKKHGGQAEMHRRCSVLTKKNKNNKIELKSTVNTKVLFQQKWWQPVARKMTVWVRALGVQT